MHILIYKYLGGGRSAVALTLIFGLEVWWCVLVWGLLFGLWKLGEGVVLLRFLWCRFRAFFLKRFIGGRFEGLLVLKVADVCSECIDKERL